MKHSYQVLGIGPICLDLSVFVSEEFLSHISGKKGGSQSIEVAEFDKLIAECGKPFYISFGGSSANAIRGLAHLGEKCAFFSYISEDTFGKRIVDQMHEIGITPIFFKSSKETPCILCLITPDGQRTMRFCNQKLDDWSDNLLELNHFSHVKLLHLSVYDLSRHHITKHTLELAKKVSATISIDLSSFEIIQKNLEEITEWIHQFGDIIFGNRDEIQTLTQLSPYEGCFKLQKHCSIVVVMMGDEGCLVGHQDKIFHCPAYPAKKIIDTTGAGDLFASGFLYGYLRNYPLEKCARFGNLLGSAVVETLGANLSIEKWNSIKKNIHYFPGIES